MNLPNILSTSRIFLLIPIIFLFESGLYFFSLITFIVASLTDYFDGYIARKKNLSTKLGALLDLVADKLFVSILLIWATYSFESFLIFLSALIIISRELTIGYLRMYLLQSGYPQDSLSPNFIGKLKTTFQMIGLGFLIVSPLNEILALSAIYIIFLSSVFSLFSLLSYLIKWIGDPK